MKYYSIVNRNCCYSNLFNMTSYVWLNINMLWHTLCNADLEVFLFITGHFVQCETSMKQKVIKLTKQNMITGRIFWTLTQINVLEQEQFSWNVTVIDYLTNNSCWVVNNKTQKICWLMLKKLEFGDTLWLSNSRYIFLLK